MERVFVQVFTRTQDMISIVQTLKGERNDELQINKFKRNSY